MAAAKPKQQASFAWLVRDALVSVGVTYLTPEHLRKSKTSDVTSNINHASLTTLLWRALHDLSMVLVADFNIDPATLAIESQSLSEEPNGTQVCIDVSRYYLYEWGFLCHEFYVSSSPLNLPGGVLLSALAFVLTHGDFFARQATAILRLQLSSDTVCISPYPHGTPVQPHHYTNAIDDTIETHLPTIVRQMESQPSIAYVVHRIHATFGALQYKVRELSALKASHASFVDRIRTTQLERLGSVLLMDKEAIAERLLSPYALWLLRHPDQLALHTQALEKRVSNFADEKMFYQWMLTVAGRLRQLPSVEQVVSGPDKSTLGGLVAAATRANDTFESAANKELYRAVSKQWKDVSAMEKSRFKTKMEHAAVKMQEELPSMELLYQPLPKKKAPPTTPQQTQPERPETTDKPSVEDQVDMLVTLMERRFKVQLV